MTIHYIALTGALAAQNALAAASNNIANVMTPGFTRQGALFAAVGPFKGGVGATGGGVSVPALLRFSDGYKNLQLWQSNSELGKYNTSQPYTRQLEQVMGDDGSSLNSGLDVFFNALNAASVDPTSAPLRQQVITSAQAMAQRFNNLNQVLNDQRASVAQQRIASVAQVNSLSAEIADLNEKIAATRATGINPSSLMDARDLKIDTLSNLVGLQVVEQDDGSASVSLRSGVPLVVGSLAASLSTVNNLDGSQTLKLTFASEAFTVTSTNLGGQLGGLDEFERNVLMPVVSDVATLAEEIANRVNTQMAAGFAMDGTPGTDLFQFDAAATGMLKVVDGVLGENLAFSADPTKPGNSDNLQALIGLREQPLIVPGLGTVRLGDVYTQVVGRLGSQNQQARAAHDTSKTVRNQAEESWKSTSGVNTDEEAINIVQYQQMYQANMKVLAVSNELFDNTLAMFG